MKANPNSTLLFLEWKTMMRVINLSEKGISMDDFDEIFDKEKALECSLLEEIERRKVNLLIKVVLAH